MIDPLQNSWRQLEEEARSSYNRIARDYSHSSHETVRNLEALNRAFLLAHLPRISMLLSLPRPIAVDLAGGHGWAARLVADLGFVSILGDISSGMLEAARYQHASRLRYCQLSAFALPLRSASVSLVTSLLCGAYLSAETVLRISDVLVRGGLFVASETPAQWVTATQPHRGMPSGRTWYKDEQGNDVLLPFGYIYGLDDISRLLSSSGFEILVAESLTPAGIIPADSLSRVNREAAQRLGLPPDRVPLLWAVVARKEPAAPQGEEVHNNASSTR